MNNKNYIIIYILSLTFLLSSNLGYSQLCDGNTSEVLFLETFGSGENFGPELASGVTTYNFGSIGNGNYVVTNTTGLNGSHWHNSPDHTPDDTNGYMLLFDASVTPGIFYQSTFAELCPNTDYVFSCFVANILTFTGCGGSPIEPNLRFRILDPLTNQELGFVDTGLIPTTNEMIWTEYAISFRTNINQDDIKIEVINIANGGCGNDLAIDDFSLRRCDPIEEITEDLCESETGIIQIGPFIFTEPGYYEFETDIENSCNTKITQLTIEGEPEVTDTIEINFCKGDTISLFGYEIFLDTVILDTISNVGNCFSSIRYEFIQLNSSLENYTIQVCSGDSIQIGNNWYSETQILIDTLFTQAGCDSIVEINIIKIEVEIDSFFINFCNGDTLYLSGHEIYQDTVILDTIFDSGLCPSIDRYEFVLNEVSFESNTYQICSGDSIQIGNNWYSESETLIETFETEMGCDSIIETIIIKAEIEIDSSVIKFCEGDTIYSFGYEIFQDSIILDTFINEDNCLSFYSYEYIAKEASIEYQIIHLCNNDSIQIGNNWYSDSQTVVYTLISEIGCDSIIEFEIINTELEIDKNDLPSSIEHGDEFQMQLNTSILDYDYLLWSPDDDLSCNQCTDPLFAPSTTGFHTLSIIDTQSQCADSIQFLVDPCSLAIFLPNAFSPNADRINDDFILYANNCILEINYVKIFDRWGGLISTRENIKSSDSLWDGYSKNRISRTGVYVYLIEVSLLDGSKKLISGDILLIT